MKRLLSLTIPLCLFLLLCLQLIQTLKKLMRPSSVEFKSPLELSAQGESNLILYIHLQIVTNSNTLCSLLPLYWCLFYLWHKKDTYSHSMYRYGAPAVHPLNVMIIIAGHYSLPVRKYERTYRRELFWALTASLINHFPDVCSCIANYFPYDVIIASVYFPSLSCPTTRCFVSILLIFSLCTYNL